MNDETPATPKATPQPQFPKDTPPERSIWWEKILYAWVGGVGSGVVMVVLVGEVDPLAVVATLVAVTVCCWCMLVKDLP
jgi:hypothetical protein